METLNAYTVACSEKDSEQEEHLNAQMVPDTEMLRTVETEPALLVADTVYCVASVPMEHDPLIVPVLVFSVTP